MEIGTRSSSHHSEYPFLVDAIQFIGFKIVAAPGCKTFDFNRLYLDMNYLPYPIRSIKPLFSLLLFILLPSLVSAQISGLLKGKVMGKNSKQETEILPFATLATLAPNPKFATTDSLGQFQIEVLGLFPQQVVVGYLGYKTDTIEVEDFTFKTITLQQGIQLKQVEVNAGNATSRMSTLSTKGVETMGKNELLKAACCNLAESFGTNASVDVVFTDAVSGAKKIQMLGLDGVYTQLTAEGIPYLRGIVSSYGLTFVPGPWMESIQIAKGAGTVTTGFDALAGQINLEFKKPNEA